jgi:hypothetical protein
MYEILMPNTSESVAFYHFICMRQQDQHLSLPLNFFTIMKRFLVLICSVLCLQIAMAQEPNAPADTTWKNIYRGSYSRINDLVHTRLDVSFDYSKSYLNGKAWITLKPHFYSTDSLLLDAKGMQINKVELVAGKKQHSAEIRVRRHAAECTPQ